jgi:adenylate kinase
MTSPSDELAYLKSLVGQLTVKINELEAKAASKKPTPSPAQQLRTILIGPPGAGVCVCRTHVYLRARALASSL